MSLKITITGNELYDYIKVDPGYDDTSVNLILAAAKLEAEQFLNTDFEQLEAPVTVKAWVFNRVAQLYENRGFSKETGRETRFVSAQLPDYAMIQALRVYPFRG